MGSQKWIDQRFGKRVKAERDDRGWSQADMAKMLSDRGIQPMHPTTVAKIEAGDRSVRINEAVGIADLMDVPLDTLLGRDPLEPRGERMRWLRAIRTTAQSGWALMDRLKDELANDLNEELPTGLEGAEALQKLGYDTLTGAVEPASEALLRLMLEAGGLFDRMLDEEAKS
jgi:transcriptional regulator with XRE-family HTH domain